MVRRVIPSLFARIKSSTAPACISNDLRRSAGQVGRYSRLVRKGWLIIAMASLGAAFFGAACSSGQTGSLVEGQSVCRQPDDGVNIGDAAKHLVPRLADVVLHASGGGLQVTWQTDGDITPAPSQASISWQVQVYQTEAQARRGNLAGETLAVQDVGSHAGGVPGGAPLGWSENTLLVTKPLGKPLNVEGRPIVGTDSVSAIFPASSLYGLHRPFYWFAEELADHFAAPNVPYGSSAYYAAFGVFSSYCPRAADITRIPSPQKFSGG